MNGEIIKDEINIFKTVSEGYSEDKMDIDILIPDYCLAAFKIIKCEVKPVVASKYVKDNYLYIDVRCFINIIYQDDENGGIKSISEIYDFSQKHELSEVSEFEKIKVKLKNVSVVCRLLNQRKINVKSTIGTAYKIMGNVHCNTIQAINDADIETKYNTFSRHAYAGCGFVDFRVDSAIDIEDDILDVINIDYKVNLTEIKPIDNKILIKGIIDFSAIYTAGETVNNLSCAESSVTFTEVINVEGCNETSICDIECDIVNVSYSVEDYSDSKTLTFEFDVKMYACVYSSVEYNLLCDMYSKESSLNVERKHIVLETLGEQMDFRSRINSEVSLDFEDARIINVISKPIIKNMTSRDTMLVIDCTVNYSIHMHNGEEYSILEKDFPIEVTREIGVLPEHLRCEANVEVHDLNYSMPSENTMLIKADLDFYLFTFEKEEFEIVDEFCEESATESNTASDKLILYYASEGENLWDIAKSHYSSVDIIKRDNDIAEDKIGNDRMLMISHS